VNVVHGLYTSVPSAWGSTIHGTSACSRERPSSSPSFSPLGWVLRLCTSAVHYRLRAAGSQPSAGKHEKIKSGACAPALTRSEALRCFLLLSVRTGNPFFLSMLIIAFSLLTPPLPYTYIYHKMQLPFPSPHLQVRVGRLTPSYRRFMLPKLRWFQGLAEAAQVFGAMWEDYEEYAGMMPEEACPTSPHAWLAAGRHGALPTGSALEKRRVVVWEVPRAELGKVIEEAAGSDESSFLDGPSWFWGGCFWAVDLRLEQPGLKLKFCVSTRSKACLPRPPVLSASFFTSCQLPDGSWDPSPASSEYDWIMSGVSYYSSSLAFPAPLKSVQQLAPHMRNGCLVLKGALQMVDVK